MGIDYNKITKALVGTSVARPNKTGTLSGHAAGEPFSVVLYETLKKDYPTTVFKQYEYLNKLFLTSPYKSPKSLLIPSPTARFLLSDKNESAFLKWTPSKLLEEKQNDTADMLYVENGFFDIIDAKTTQIKKNAQPPNIISAFKVANMCATMIKYKDFDSVDIHYVSMDWIENGGNLQCVGSTYKSLFKIIPEELYINWSAALQIQFHPQTVKQDFNGSKQEWAKLYLGHFVKSAEKRIGKMRKDFVDEFTPYL